MAVVASLVVMQAASAQRGGSDDIFIEGNVLWTSYRYTPFSFIADDPDEPTYTKDIEFRKLNEEGWQACDPNK